LFYQHIIRISDLYFFFIRRSGNSHRFLTPTRLSASEPQNLLVGVSMLDLLMLAIGFGLFILTVGYAVACDRL